MQNTEVYVKTADAQPTLKISCEVAGSHIYVTTDANLPGSLAIVEILPEEVSVTPVGDGSVGIEEAAVIHHKQLALFAKHQWEWVTFKNPTGCWTKTNPV